ncbi:MAG: methyltransferase [Elusimicrobia bacterium]|nr:methyltransferase [Elusimicrobiota bacterium]
MRQPELGALLDISRGFMASRVLLTGYELGVFTALGRGPRSSAQVARAVKADPRATDRLLSALCCLGLLRKKGGCFCNMPTAARFLVRGRQDYLAGLGHTVDLWDTWSTLTAAVRAGRSVLKDPPARRARRFFVPFIAAMHERAVLQAKSVVASLPLAGVRQVLDVGGGSGAYALAFARARPALRATVFDLPQVAPLTRGYIKKAGLSGRVGVRVGDYDRDALPRGNDLVFLSAIIHSCSPAGTRKLFQKCARALNPGGLIVVQEFVVDEGRTAPAFSVLFALNMLVATPGGDAYTESEIGSWLRAAGFRAIKRKDTRFDTALVTGRLPRA